MLTGDGNKKCQKKLTRLTSEKKNFSRAADFFVYFFAIVLYDPKVKFLSSGTFYGGKVVSVPTFQFKKVLLFSLSLTFTLLAAEFLLFSPQLWSLHVLSYNEVGLFSFFVCFIFRSSSLSVIGVSLVVVNMWRTDGHVITKFSRIYSLPFFLSYAQELG